MTPPPVDFAAELSRSLALCGVVSGDTLFFQPEDGVAGLLPVMGAGERFEAIIRAVLAVVGPSGTLVLPTYTYSFSRGEIFSKTYSRSALGAITDYFRRRPKVVRSANPMYSVAACGRHADLFAQSDAYDCFGADTAFGLLHRLNAKIVTVGGCFENLAPLQYIEQSAGVDYRRFREFRGVVEENNAKLRMERVRSYVRDPKRRDILESSRIRQVVESHGLLRTARMGPFEVLAIDASDLFDAGIAVIAHSDLIPLIIKGRASACI